MVNDPQAPLRVPGGGIYEGESVEQALFREIREETGLVNPPLLRKLGMDRYTRATTQTTIERHNFLLKVPSSLPDSWEHRATGEGNDAGKSFLYQWIDLDDLDLVDEEFQSTITPETLPEFFEVDRGGKRSTGNA
jgi:ADP-ribose pyrophosphatase YjhB (NUDIX family)